MSPIRIAIIGLSASAKTSWAKGAHLPYLTSPRGRAKYQIVALCNSSVKAAQSAITTFNLPPDTKAYGDPEALAKDPDVELVVCCTRVDVHYDTILPSVKAGKDVYVEWPLAENDKRARELVRLAEESGSRTVVGMQGRCAPVVVKLRDLIREGRIGKVLSSEIRAFGGSNDRESLASGLKYFADSKIGGNIYTIGLGHLFDQIQYVLGDFANLEGHLHLQRPYMKLKDTATGEITETVPSNVPDLMVLAGSLAASPTTQRDASVLYRFRRGQPFPGDPALVWTINGEAGELRLVAHDGTTLHGGAYSGPLTLELDDFESGKVETVEWTWEDWQEELPFIARIIGSLYERFAEGGEVPTFKDALARHEQLDGMLRKWESSRV